jgi:tetratricopeptide (TPR) repeat protein
MASIRSLGAYSEDLLSIVMIAPLALGLILYFRFLFGYFMRNFERQADLFALQVLESPRPLIQSLEKIGLYSGQGRDLPNWHHFSIGQRIAFLEQSSLNPRIGRRHQKKVLASVGLFFFLLTALGLYGLYNNTLLNPGLGGDPKALESWLGNTLRERPDDPRVLMALALLYHEQKRLTLARETYEKILQKNPHHVLALNNLAWLLVTGKEPSHYQPQRALRLARKAAELQPEPVILDTLAEAYLANGHPEQALEMIRQALARRPSNRAYYESQREKFEQALKKNTRSE